MENILIIVGLVVGVYLVYRFVIKKRLEDDGSGGGTEFPPNGYPPIEEPPIDNPPLDIPVDEIPQNEATITTKFDEANRNQ